MAKSTELNIEPLTRIEGHMGVNAKADLDTKKYTDAHVYATMFRGLEDTGKITIEPRALREGYLAAVERFCTEVKRKCIASRVDYKLVSTADHLDAALLAFLAARAAAARKAGAKS